MNLSMNSNFILNPSFLANNLMVVPETDKSTYEVLGSNQKHILVVYQKTATPFKREMLEKILSALGHNIDKDIALIGIKDTQEFCFSDWEKALQPKYVIVFGKTMKSLGLQLNNRPYSVTKAGGCQFLLADSLETLDDPAHKAKKLAFWNCCLALFPKNNKDV